MYRNKGKSWQKRKDSIKKEFLSENVRNKLLTLRVTLQKVSLLTVHIKWMNHKKTHEC